MATAPAAEKPHVAAPADCRTGKILGPVTGPKLICPLIANLPHLNLAPM